MQNEESKSKERRKRLLIFILVQAVIFCATSVTWYVIRYVPFKRLTSGMQPENTDKSAFIYSDKKYDYRVNMPTCYSFESGSMTVSPKEKTSYIIDDDVVPTKIPVPDVTLFIWPKINSETYFAVSIVDGSSDVFIEMNRSEEFIPKDNLSEEENARLRKLFEEHKSEIHDLMDAAEEFFGDIIQ